MSVVLIFVVGLIVTLLAGAGAFLVGVSDATDLEAGVDLPNWERKMVDHRRTEVEHGPSKV